MREPFMDIDTRDCEASVNVTDEDRSRGLYNKYEVRRTDGREGPGTDHDGCFLFVLDVTHDPHAQAALKAYIASCREDYPALAADLEAALVA